MPQDFDPNRSASQAYGRLWRDWLRPYRATLFLTLMLMVIVALASAGYAKFIQMVIEGFETASNSVIWWGPLGIIVLTLSKGVSQYLQNVLQNQVMSRMQADIQTKMYASLVTMDLAHLLAESPSALSARFSADVELIRNASRQVFSAVTAILTVIATFGVMLSIDWAMTLGLILIFALAFGPVGIVGARVKAISATTQEEIAQMVSSVDEGLSGIRMVRAYRLEDRLKDSSKAVFENLYKLRVSLVKWQAILSPMMEILGGLAVGALFFLVALRMRSGAIDLAGFIGLLTALGVATNPARKLGGAYAIALQGQAALDRVFALFDTPNTIRDGSFEFASGDKAKGLVEFRDVDFTYPDGFQALHGINLRIEAGKTYAFVGRSGAGKSTVFNLLPRLFDATSGVIYLDGRPITEYTLPALRDQISVVSQDSVLLSGSVLENISFGREGASEVDCIKAAKSAAAHKFITKLPEGFNTHIEPAKIKFSGGERQRLSIARAILRDAPILLLDEPTSALDAESENQIRTALDVLSEGRTTLIIAHRLSTILDADQIVVMDQGAVVAQGSHDELLEQGGIYADLFNLQFDLSPESSAPKRKRSFSNGQGRWKSPLEGLVKFFGG
ncbi:ABC transporter permease [Amylibacter marinus]|uniref:ABC transporter permease n=1 Tax=Amylibacter marinus TaxID=1475483 RepID=A0ABQ5VR38_9RHOB|nr:ABC transporter ATP-binding protein [Amylibacter marinus]GLQ33882.1 ABC transporter permease [Amylibacter marinus]